MLRITDLPHDFILHVTGFMDIQDICNLRSINRKMLQTIQTLQSHIVKKEFECLHRQVHYCSRTNVVLFVENHVLLFCNRMYSKMYNQYDAQRGGRRVTYKEFNEYLQETIPHLAVFCSHHMVDVLYKEIFTHVIKHGTLNNFQNKLSIFVVYLFTEIIYNPNPTSNTISYIISFINRLTYYDCNRYISLATSYYCYLIHYQMKCAEMFPLSFFLITLDDLYIMSKYVTTHCILKKLIGYKPLSLKNTLMVKCCNSCETLQGMQHYVHVRYNLSNDVVGHNYNEIRDLVFTFNRNLYVHMRNEELSLVDKEIFVTDPISNRNIHITTNHFKRIISKLEKRKNFNAIHILQSIIYRKRLVIHKKYFE
jgi:hypothetical protein